jgi:hypothetical protein
VTLIGDEVYSPRAARAAVRRRAANASDPHGRRTVSEAAVCRAVDEAILVRRDAYWINITGAAEQTAGTPDRVGVVDGRAFACEIKAPGARPRPRQLVELRRWQDGGALVGWVESVEQLDELLAHVHDRRWTNPLTGPGDPTLGGNTHDGLADAATAGDP